MDLLFAHSLAISYLALWTRLYSSFVGYADSWLSFPCKILTKRMEADPKVFRESRQMMKMTHPSSAIRLCSAHPSPSLTEHSDTSRPYCLCFSSDTTRLRVSPIRTFDATWKIRNRELVWRPKENKVWLRTRQIVKTKNIDKIWGFGC